MDRKHQKRICFVMTVTSALRVFMADHIRVLAKLYEVTVFCNFSVDHCRDLFDGKVRLFHIPFERKISPWRDLKCLVILFAALRREHFDSIHSVMPKTGLLGMMAGFFARVPVRIHTFTGQVWVTLFGFWRILLKAMDRLIALFATDLYADSPSQFDFLVAEHVIKTGKVLGDGSINGVDTDRFKPDPVARQAIRKQHSLSGEVFVFGLLTRLTRDKGVFDSIEAFSQIAEGCDAHLLLAGPDEEGVIPWARNRYPYIQNRIHFRNEFIDNPEEFLAALDVFCQQSYKEGFGSSVILAAACGVPALVSRIYGLTDAVEENVTGLMHEPGNIREICEGMRRYTLDIALIKTFGESARERVTKKFSRNRLVMEMIAEYERLLDSD